MPEPQDSQRFLNRAEAPELIDAATQVAGFDLGKRPEFASAANVSGVRNRTFTFSRRRDSRTIFAADARYGIGGRAGAWQGGDREVVGAVRRVLKAAGVPAKEVVSVNVLSEFGAAGEVVDGEVRAEEPTLLRKIGAAQRAIDQLPVWSSYAKVGLTADGRVGWLELHWPVVGPEVLKEAHVLQSLVERGFPVAEMPGARLQSVEAGVLHSPAIGFFMDVTAAARLAYEPEDPEMGRLATLYLDRHGDLVALPRDIRPVKPDERKREAPAE